jgi:hypothetical protein
MVFRFNARALFIAALLFAVEVGIATILRHIGWVRGFLGDMIAIALVYYTLKSIVRATYRWLASAALLVGYALEACQYLARENHLVLQNRVLRILFGSTPDWWDMLAYTLGFLAVLGIEAHSKGRETLHRD